MSLADQGFERVWASRNGHASDALPTGILVLESLIRFIRRYVALGEDQAVLIALWTVHTHAFDGADTTPYLNIKSAEKRSGKTRLLEVLSLLVARPWLTGRVSSAVLVRKVAAEVPTLLLDESDAAFNSDREYAETLRGVLNTGFRRGGVASLCVGQGAGLTYKDFPVFSPKAIAGIGTLPDTVADRSIPIELRRRKLGETVERFRLRKVGPEALDLRGGAAAWAETHLDDLFGAEPNLPEELDDRAQDIIEPLLAIADAAGGEWPERARRSARALLTGEGREDAESLGVRLLREVRDVFDQKGGDRLPTAELLHALHKIEEAPWRSLRGEPLDARGLARLLKPYGARPGTIREGKDTCKGYLRTAFADAWSRYAPDASEDTSENAKHPSPTSHPSETADSRVTHGDRVTEHDGHAEQEKSHKQAHVTDVTDVTDNPDSSTGVRFSGPPTTPSDDVRRLFENPPDWLRTQEAKCRREGAPKNQAKALAAAVAAHLTGDPTRGGEVLPIVAARFHPLDCECELCP